MKPQFPTVQEQIDYWNTKERLEHERVMNIRAENPNDPAQTGEALLAALEEVELRTTQAQIASRIGKRNNVRTISFLVGQLEQIGKFARATIDASNPQDQDSNTALTLDQTEATCEIYDEREAKWSLRDEGSIDGEGESYAARNL